MINHARTLLLNIDGTTNADPYGAEYVEDNYVAKRLPSYVLRVREILFGRNPDALYRNYRLAQLMNILHATELEEFVVALDPRITYTTGELGDLYADTFGLIVSKLGATTADLSLIGSLRVDDEIGRSLRNWRVSASGYVVTVQQRTPPGPTVETTYTDVSGISSLITLPGSDLTFRLPTGTTGAWLVESKVRPSVDLGDLASRMGRLGEDVLLELFGVGSDRAGSEPFKTFKNLWYQHPALAYKLGGLLLAVIYRTDEI